MSYKKATDILPERVLLEIQNYVDGEYIYIPRKDSNRKNWGEISNIKEELANRNIQIYDDFLQGVSKKDLSYKYHLTEKTLQKIISKIKADSK